MKTVILSSLARVALDGVWRAFAPQSRSQRPENLLSGPMLPALRAKCAVSAYQRGWISRRRTLGTGVAAGTSLMLFISSLHGAQQRPFIERVEVARVLIDARVVDDFGRPVLGLGPADFDVKIDGRRVRVESAQWVGGDLPRSSSLPSTGLAGVIEPQAHGRLVVFLVQKSLVPSRAIGLMQLLLNSGQLLTTLTPSDRVAVLSFDSHLKMWLDFTGDLNRVREILGSHVLLRNPGRIEPASGPSLLGRLNQEDGRKIYTIEKALHRLGDALEPLPGSKSIILVGYGFGRFTAGGVILMDGYDEASAALQRARAVVFCLDITVADYHSLEVGLQAVAGETGGFFARTHLFPRQAIDRVTNALVGHYVLFTEKPDGEPGPHRIDVQLTRREGTVLARTTYVD